MSRTLASLVVLSLSMACGNKDSGPAAGTTEPDPCKGRIVTPYPSVGATGVYYRTSIEFDFAPEEAVEDGATLTVDGVTGTQSIDGSVIKFTPDAPLAPSTSYDMTLDWDCGPTTSNFTTSDIGAATTPASLVGKTYTVDIGVGRFVQPANIGSLVGGLLETPLLLGVVAADDTTVTFKSVPASSTDQCNELSDFDPGSFGENPYFEATGAAIELDLQDVIVTLANTEITGAFSSSGDKIAGLTLSGVLDVAPLEPVIESDPCETLESVGAVCEPCPDGVAQSCLTVVVDGLTAPEDTAVDFSACP